MPSLLPENNYRKEEEEKEEYGGCNDNNNCSCQTTSGVNVIAAVVSVSKSVSFSSSQAREYAITLGDNPSVSSGAPITLDWHYHQHDPILLEEKNEDGKEINERHRRNRRRCPPTLNYYERRYLLFQAGVSARDQQKAERTAEQIRRQRARSAAVSFGIFGGKGSGEQVATSSRWAPRSLLGGENLYFGFFSVETAIQSAARKTKRILQAINSPKKQQPPTQYSHRSKRSKKRNSSIDFMF